MTARCDDSHRTLSICVDRCGVRIADFCCDELKIVVELDGGVHADRREYDAARDAHASQSGYVVLRLSNVEVESNPEEVLERLLSEILKARDRVASARPLLPLREKRPGEEG